MFRRAFCVGLCLVVVALSASGCGLIGGLFGGEDEATPAPPATSAAAPQPTDEPTDAPQPTTEPTSTPVPPTSTPQPAPTAEPTEPPAPTEEATAEPTEEPSAEETEEPSTEETETPPDTGEGLFTAPLALDELTSYRYTAELTWESEDEDTESGRMLIETAFQADPPAQHMIVQTWDLEGVGDSDMEMILIEGDMYMRYEDEEWITIASETDDLWDQVELGWMGDMSAMFGDVEPEYLGQESIDGVLADHYALDEESLVTSGWTGVMGVSEVTEAQMDLWVSVEHEAPIKTVVVIDGTADGEQARVTMESTITDIGEDVDIQPPEGVDAPGLPDDIPVMEGANGLTVMMGIANYTIGISLQAVIDWHLENMESNGWTYSEEESMAPSMLTWTKEGRSVLVMPSEDSGLTNVTIMFGEEE